MICRNRCICFATVMWRKFLNRRAFLVCASLFLLLIIISNFERIPSNYTSKEPAKLSVSTTLFDNERKDVILNCITGEVVGMRPWHINTVDVRQLRPSDHRELDEHRKAMFNKIFHKKIWGKNSNVNFSASGRPMLFCYITITVLFYRLRSC